MPRLRRMPVLVLAPLLLALTLLAAGGDQGAANGAQKGVPGLSVPGLARPYRGIEIEHFVLAEPRPNRLWIVRIDPDAVEWVATPGNGDLPRETTIATTRAFAEQAGAVLAFNGHFYRLQDGANAQTLSRLDLLLNPYADVHGLAISGGETVSEHQRGYPAVAVGLDGRMRLYENGLIPRDAPPPKRMAVAGNIVLVRGGRNVVPADRVPSLHPRTFIGARADGTILVGIVDGRQPGVSEGLTDDDMAGVLLAEGAEFGVNLDGGGSTTLVLADPATGAHRVVNTPVGLQNRPGTERPTGFNVGVVPAERGGR